LGIKGKNGSMKKVNWQKQSFNAYRHLANTQIDTYVNSGENKNTSNPKPTALYKFCLERYTKEGDEILDTH
jgi:DNA modification methylase